MEKDTIEHLRDCEKIKREGLQNEQENEQDWIMKLRRRTKLVENYKLFKMNVI